ncbi:2-oxoacid:acceptor oxidoreductase family protein [Uliginosibacterium gangwonense]|uniref:2-oxoacid:acceptor oxidoreductase family protein n=1 Tax=Uliginosibacterium gangwonense TaxID=392736 RepID=UPI00037D906B|nr:2-oxoacid:acceptor oxidoreductase family protein [Uliginosibacterium gangwonense]
MASKVINVVVAGLGGQGVVKASDILADAAFRCGLDVKKSEIHGMSQRGGSVASDVRFGPHVYSPMIPAGQADCLIVVAPDQVEVNRHVLKASGILVSPESLATVPGKIQAKSVNVALLGVLSNVLEIPLETWEAAICANLAEKHHRLNLEAFHQGRQATA